MTTYPRRPRVLFISYNSLIEPLGLTQVVPYVRMLAADYSMCVLSFEKPVGSREQDARAPRLLESLLQECGAQWIRASYHKWPSLPATLFDIGIGICRAVREYLRGPFALVHARGYVPGAVAWGLKRCLGLPYIFDIRGLQAEEYVDAGHWDPRGVHFRLTKRVEQYILHNADGIVTLTEAVRPILQSFRGLQSRQALPPWEVIPCCADLDHFRFRVQGRRRVRARLGVGDRPILVYAGSIGTWYLLDEMIEFYTVAHREWPGLFFLILVNGSSDNVVTTLRRHGVSDSDAAVGWAPVEELPDYLSAADAGIAFIRPCLSKRSSSPTKYAEYLACGLPIVTNYGIGDAEAWIEPEGAGVLVSAFDDQAYASAANALKENAERGRDAFREIAERRFSVAQRAYPAYRRLYEAVLTA